MVPFIPGGLGRGVLCACLFALCVLVPASRAQQPIPPEISVGETPQQVNQRIKTLTMGGKSSSTTSPVAHDYVIGNGDLLDISVFDVPELTREVRVSQMGTVSMPLVPVRLRLAGLTETQAEEKIAEVLEANGLVTHAEVGVLVKEHHSQPITIVGAVQHPMVYQADRSVTLLEVLAEAGGIAVDAGDTIIVTRPQASAFTELQDGAPISPVSTTAPGSGEAQGPAPTASTPDSKPFPSADDLAKQPQDVSPGNPGVGEWRSVTNGSTSITINLNELLESGDTHNNIALHAGDVVTVPHAGIVYVLGAVTRPGGFVVSNDRTQLTTLKVLSLAGGLTNIAQLQHAVIIRKDGQGKQTETEVDLRKVLHRQSEDLTMRASDILYVPDDRTKQFLFRAGEIGLGIGSAVAIWRLAYH